MKTIAKQMVFAKHSGHGFKKNHGLENGRFCLENGWVNKVPDPQVWESMFGTSAPIWKLHTVIHQYPQH